MSLVRESIHLRPAEEADQEFLFTVFASTRAEEMALTGWSAGQIEAFLRDQFHLQDLHYRRHYPGARFQVLHVDGAPAGRLYLHRGATDLRVMDLALLPEFRRRGVGGALLASVLREAEALDLSVSLHVEAHNPARQWYKRLGFLDEGGDGIYVLMRRPAPLETRP